jgi:release factor glutamine methyltransferase
MSQGDNPAVPGTRTPRGPPEPRFPVYPSREDTFLLLPFARVAARTSFLEVGTGAGQIALTAARRGARVVATDRNPHALRRLAAIARTERLDLQLVRTDLARGLGRFDRVVANPPYLPTHPEERDPDPWHNLALDGGPDGCATTGRLVEDLGDHLRPRGSAFVLTSSLQSASRLHAIWEEWQVAGGSVRAVAYRELEGERLEVYRLRPAVRRGLRTAARRTKGPRRGTGARPRTRPGPPSG